jgi:hypothetical protein
VTDLNSDQDPKAKLATTARSLRRLEASVEARDVLAQQVAAHVCALGDEEG